ncbi:hypothetical protein RRF57_005684 [Xylaria bambusicola]|uniref:Uncharacterized protein n=1 Tax=Xylaria bambusicola TaxID=326684 RepID=A0AAN7UQN6_9PEZI
MFPSPLKRNEAKLRYQYPRGIIKGLRHGWSYAHTVAWQGPASLDILQPQENKEPGHFLEVLRLCRMKLAPELRDNVFGVLGILPKSVQRHFPLGCNYLRNMIHVPNSDAFPQ